VIFVVVVCRMVLDGTSDEKIEVEEGSFCVVKRQFFGHTSVPQLSLLLLFSIL